MTTDFYVISKNIKSITSQLALQAKYSKDLDDTRTIEKLELELRYWDKKMWASKSLLKKTYLELSVTILNGYTPLKILI